MLGKAKFKHPVLVDFQSPIAVLEIVLSDFYTILIVLNVSYFSYYFSYFHTFCIIADAHEL